MNDFRNLLITLVLSSVILISWQVFYENPRLAKIKQQNIERAQENALIKKEALNTVAPLVPREQVISGTKRIRIETDHLLGSIALQGARLDDLSLPGYKETIKKDSANVVLFSPSTSTHAYFAEFGWIAAEAGIKVPDNSTIWTADKEVLKPNETVNLSWNNGQGQLFNLAITLDEHYMFTVKQTVKNSSPHAVSILPYGLINRIWAKEHNAFAILHEGPLGVFNDVLHETSYKDMEDEGRQQFKQSHNGWLGITDKYWLSALVPDQQMTFDGNYVYTRKNDVDRFQVDYLGQKITLGNNESVSYTNHLFAGAKKLSLLDGYSEKLNIPLFDRAVDFGWFYFLTKPMFKTLQFFYHHVGNFGIAILIMTVLVKLIMFPLANKSYLSMSKMKKLQPEMVRLREKYENDKMQLNREVMELYKREKVNPLSGCLPLFIQIPVFFSLYKVLFVTIEMRHAPFFGWIHDLSAPDPTSLFNLFGLIPWTPPSFLMIGIWPIIMGITMLLQQKMNPEPTDPVQAKVMKLLPIFFVIMFHSFPAGLIIYWAWNNFLSIIQQWFINRSVERHS